MDLALKVLSPALLVLWELFEAFHFSYKKSIIKKNPAGLLFEAARQIRSSLSDKRL